MAELILPLQKSCQYRNRRVRALRPFADDYNLLAAVNRGEFMINGLRNRDLQRILYTHRHSGPQGKETAVCRGEPKAASTGCAWSDSQGPENTSLPSQLLLGV